ncbi:MAG: hypothetical protein BWZ09_01577 [Alphaproteobacteria bacterium ADurb.BinA305]|nr:MAG: hypothetical protein BWZ09_01577 [Alphaproteobacteria bacterium ADurb.BinA305]
MHAPAILLQVAAEADAHADLGAGELPRVAVREPVVGHLDLLPVDDLLAEHAVVVADAVAEAGHAERGHGVEKAGGEATEAAVAERGVGLELGQAVGVDVEQAQRLAHRAGEFEGEHGVAQAAADEELHRQVIDALDVLRVARPCGLHPALDQVVAHGVGDCVQPVFRQRRLGVLADLVHQLVGDRALERLDVGAGAVVLEGELGKIHGDVGEGPVIGWRGRGRRGDVANPLV